MEQEKGRMRVEKSGKEQGCPPASLIVRLTHTPTWLQQHTMTKTQRQKWERKHVEGKGIISHAGPLPASGGADRTGG